MPSSTLGAFRVAGYSPLEGTQPAVAAAWGSGLSLPGHLPPLLEVQAGSLLMLTPQKEVCGGGAACGRMLLARFLGNPALSEKGLSAAPGSLKAHPRRPIAGPVAGPDCCLFPGAPASVPVWDRPHRYRGRATRHRQWHRVGVGGEESLEQCPSTSQTLRL